MTKLFQNILITVLFQLKHHYYHFNTGSTQKPYLAPKSRCSNYGESVHKDTVFYDKELGIMCSFKFARGHK